MFKRHAHLAGMVCATVFNAKRTKDSDRWFVPGDFVGEEPRKATPEQIHAAFASWAQTVNAMAKA